VHRAAQPGHQVAAIARAVVGRHEADGAPAIDTEQRTIERPQKFGLIHPQAQAKYPVHKPVDKGSQTRMHNATGA
jgi:hypothetical protein